jgi:sarcosine oxidase subunit alpha
MSARPGEVIDRSDTRRFTWNGAVVSGFGGDTIASALAASGVSVFSRSFKYHRPRGILTADQHDPNLFVSVGGEPNVRAGHRLVDRGIVVSAQNAWPSLRFDLRTANRIVGRFLTPGFYYKTFMGPRPLRPLYQRTLRRFGAGGTVRSASPDTHSEKRFAHPDVLVAGGGPAGMAAAVAASAAGARVLLVDDNHHLGGHLRYSGVADLPALTELRDEVAASEAIEVVTDAVVAGRFDENWVGVVVRSASREQLIKARAKCLVVAAGKIERPYVFEGNDLPGVMLSGAAMRLMNLWAVRPGTRAVVVTGNDSGDRVAEQLESAGVAIAEVVDLRTSPDRLVRARGRRRVAKVELAGGSAVAADLLVTAVGWTTPTSLLNMAGDRPVYEASAARFLPGDLPRDVLATGEIVGDGSLDEIVAHGRAVGAEAARRARQRALDWARATPRAARPSPLAPVEPVEIPRLDPAGHPEIFAGATDGFVDYSEDIRGKDMAFAATEGYDSIELAKRYTTATMGPIQGKLEVVNAVAVHAAATQATIAETGTTTWRPPYAPITLGALAGRGDAAVRRSPMHDWHADHGARPLVAGQWIRPDHYGDPVAEVNNTRTKVGIIDVSPLGKIDLRGGDVPKLLEFVYTNKWSQLGVGRVRYGAMCGEDGVVFDDGVTARLDEDRYYMTTTSSGAAGVWNWLDEWLQTFFPQWDVRMTAVTDGYAAMNVAGPASRRLLERVVDGVDLSADAFGYMHARSGTVAGVPGCVLLRIGFTGELSFEVHAPAGFGLHVWRSLLDAGADLGVAPFGVEAQRIMRLEKGHLIVGQDTDGLTKAGAAALGWAVKTEKADFAGRPELVWEAESGPDRMLVALQPEDPRLVPPEASQIVRGDAIVGRVTSSRMSPTLGRSVCLAVVGAELANPGTSLLIHLEDGSRAPARVMEHHAHFDPEGERLRG